MISRREFLNPFSWFESEDGDDKESPTTVTKTVANQEYEFALEETVGDVRWSDEECIERWYLHSLSNDLLWTVIGLTEEISSTWCPDNKIKIVVSVSEVEQTTPDGVRVNERGQVGAMALVGMMVFLSLLFGAFALVMVL